MKNQIKEILEKYATSVVRYLFGDKKDTKDEILDKAVEEIAAMFPRWIPVEDRVPEIDVRVLGYFGFGYYDICWVHADGDWESQARSWGVTHWMPLPPVPNHFVDANKKM